MREPASLPTRTVRLVALVLILASLVALAPAPASAQSLTLGLTSFCTPAQDFPAFRRFRVTNPNSVPVDAVLRNQNTGATVPITVPPGASFWSVPTSPNPNAANTTQLSVNKCSNP